MSMQVTLFSFFSSVLWSSVLIVGIYGLRKARRFRTNFGLSALVLLYLFSIMRILIPLELPHVIELGIDEVYPEIYRFLTTDLSYGEHLHFSYLDVLVCIWVAGIVILTIRYIVNYHKAMRGITKYASPCGEREYTSLDAVKRDIGKSMKVSLCTVPNISVPFGIGVFQKTILLPQNKFTGRELYYILLHEYTHFLNQDIPVKMMVSVFCCIFWWNPISYLLKADLEQTLEMKCDAAVANSLDAQGKVDYLRTIVGFMKQSATEESTPYTSTALIHAKRTMDVKERFDVVMYCDSEQKQALPQISLLLIGACIFVLSYIVIPQPTFDAPLSNEPNTVDFDSANSYICQDSNGAYWLCIESQEPLPISDRLADSYQQTGLSIIKE